jgi:hypothetical protein
MRRIGRPAGVAAAAVAALLLSACSSDGGSPGGGAGGGGESAQGGGLLDALGDVEEWRDRLSFGSILGAEDFAEEDLDEWEDWEDWEDGAADPDPDTDAGPDEDAPDRRGVDVGGEIHGIWQGDDQTFLGIISSEESSTGIANSFHYTPATEVECQGLLFGDAAEGWTTMIRCGEEDAPDEEMTVHTAALSLANERVTLTWTDDDTFAGTVVYVWAGDWED